MSISDSIISMSAWHQCNLIKVINMGQCFASRNISLRNTIQQQIIQAGRLNYISLRNHELERVPSQLDSTNIKTIDLGNNYIVCFALQLSSMDNLQILVLDNNRITAFTHALSSSLRILNLNENLLKSFHDIEFPNLEKLSLNNNCLTSIDDIKDCNKLEHLEVNINTLTSLPNFLCGLKGLIRAEFAINQIDNLEINWKPSKLTTLDLSSNKISKVPAAILTNTNLCHIRLVKNLITSKRFMKIDGIQEYMARKRAYSDGVTWKEPKDAKNVLD